MTGTAFTEAEEFQQIYALDVIQIPPNTPIQRVDKDDLIFRTKAGKLRAIANEIENTTLRANRSSSVPILSQITKKLRVTSTNAA